MQGKIQSAYLAVILGCPSLFFLPPTSLFPPPPFHPFPLSVIPPSSVPPPPFSSLALPCPPYAGITLSSLCRHYPDITGPVCRRCNRQCSREGTEEALCLHCENGALLLLHRNCVSCCGCFSRRIMEPGG